VENNVSIWPLANSKRATLVLFSQEKYANESERDGRDAIQKREKDQSLSPTE
jgi:hypothetical protein